MRLIQVTAPLEPALSLEAAKKHLRVEHNRDDELIEAYRDAATAEVDGPEGIGRALVDQVWDLFLPCWPAREISIPLPPLLEVVSVNYFDDQNNVEQVLADTVYEVVGQKGYAPAKIVLKDAQSWPSIYTRSEPVRIRFRAGYVDTVQSPAYGAVPSPLLSAIRLMLGTYYSQRETVVIGQTIMVWPNAVAALLDKYRVYYPN